MKVWILSSSNIFKDFFFFLPQLNPDVNAFQRKFVNEVRRCDEMERKLRYIEAEVHKDGVHIPSVKEAPRAPNPREIIDLEVRIFKKITFFSQVKIWFIDGWLIA